MTHPKLTIQASAAGAEVLIYECIGDWGITAKSFAEQLKPLAGQALTVRIHSDGGSVFDGLAIYNALKRHVGGVSVEIDGIAASMASVIALAGDHVKIAANGYIMIHAPSDIVFDNAEEMKKSAATLEKIQGTMADIYASATGKSVAEVQAWMADETWFTASEALAAGLVDEITEEKQIAAKLKHLAAFRRTPAKAASFAASKPLFGLARAIAAHRQQPYIKAQIEAGERRRLAHAALQQKTK